MNRTLVEHMPEAIKVPSSTLGFVITLLYMIFEYGRPQDQINLLGALRPGLLLASLLLILLIANSPRLRMAASPQTSRMILLLSLMALHVPFAVNNGRAYIATQGFLLNLIEFISIIIFVDNIDKLRIFINWWIALMVNLAANGILGGGSAGSSFLLDENDFALLMNMMLPFSTFLFFYEKKMKLKLLYLIASFLCIASIVASFSRGGFIGLLVVGFVLWITSPKKILILMIAVILFFVVANLPITHVGTTTAGSTYWEEMSTIDSGDDYNKDSRVELWKAGWHMFIDYPLGVGPQNFPVRLPEYQSEYFTHDMWGKVAHSIWFTLLPELGIPGFLLFLSLFLANLRDVQYLVTLPKNENDIQRLAHFLSLAFITSIAGYFAAGTFLSALYYPHYWFLTAMIVATRKVIDSASSSKSEARESSS